MRSLLVRGGAVWQLVGLITRRSQVQILPPLPISFQALNFSAFFWPSGYEPDQVGLACLLRGPKVAGFNETIFSVAAGG